MTACPQDPAPWHRQGKDPDYRFSLANERTFLAWIRTALAILAGALVLHQLGGLLRLGRMSVWLCAFLSVFAALLGAVAYPRWKQIEMAMRHDRSLPRSRIAPALAAITALVSVAAAVAILLEG